MTMRLGSENGELEAMRTLVESPRVREEIQKLYPNRKIKSILSRGNYAKGTFLVIFEDRKLTEPGEMVTIPPVPKK